MQPSSNCNCISQNLRPTRPTRCMAPGKWLLTSNGQRDGHSWRKEGRWGFRWHLPCCTSSILPPKLAPASSSSSKQTHFCHDKKKSEPSALGGVAYVQAQDQCKWRCCPLLCDYRTPGASTRQRRRTARCWKQLVIFGWFPLLPVWIWERSGQVAGTPESFASVLAVQATKRCRDVRSFRVRGT